MRYLKRLNEKYINTFNENELNGVFNLVLSDTDIYKLPFGHYSSFDFNIYIIKF